MLILVQFILRMSFGMAGAMALGEVGKVGVSICSIRDMRILFQEIPLDKVSTSMTINAPAAVLLAMYIAVAEEQGVRFDHQTSCAF